MRRGAACSDFAVQKHCRNAAITRYFFVTPWRMLAFPATVSFGLTARLVLARHVATPNRVSPVMVFNLRTPSQPIDDILTAVVITRVALQASDSLSQERRQGQVPRPAELNLPDLSGCWPCRCTATGDHGDHLHYGGRFRSRET